VSVVLAPHARPTAELRLGLWQKSLADVDRCDVVITDPPYSERTVKGQRSNSSNGPRSNVRYGWLTQTDVWDFVSHWAPRAKRWFVMFGDHHTVRWALEALEARGWYHFPPLPWIKTDAMPRVASEGPSPHAEFLAIARPRRALTRVEKRYRKGYYEGPSRPGRIKGVVGAKPLWLLEQLLRDYSEPGDLVVDPYAGGGSTVRAALALGRSALGAEARKVTWAKGQTLLAKALIARAEAA
jgi:site-specific DNA-methyltransferase (adenine-specific)